MAFAVAVVVERCKSIAKHTLTAENRHEPEVVRKHCCSCMHALQAQESHKAAVENKKQSSGSNLTLEIDW